MLSASCTAHAFRRPLAAAAIAAAACLTVTPIVSPHNVLVGPAGAQAGEKCAVSQVSWGVRQSFRNYIEGRIAKGGWETEGTVSYNGDEFVFNEPFPPIETTNDGTTIVPLGEDNGIRFYGHSYNDKPKLDMTLKDFRIAVNGSSAKILVDYDANLPEDMSADAPDNFVRGDDVAIAEVALNGTPDFTSGTVDLSGDVTLTDIGDKLFLGNYGTGGEMDPLNANINLGTDCAARVVSVTNGNSSGGRGNGGGSKTTSTKKNNAPGLDALKTVNDYGTAVNNLLSTTDKIITNIDKLGARFNQNGASANGAGTGGGTVNRASAATGGASGAGNGGGDARGGGAAGRAVGTAGTAGGGNQGAAGDAASTSGGGAGSVCTAESSLGVTEASAAWGVKQSFQSYITGSIAKGSWELSGVSHSDGEFHFAGNSGAVDPKANTGTILFPGSMHFTGHKGVLQLNMSNMEIQWNGNSGSLVATVSSNNMEGQNTDFGRVALANLSFNQLNVGDNAASGSATASLTQAGAQAFADFYPEGTQLDPISFTASLGGAASCAAGQGSGASGGGVAGAGGNAAAAAATKAGGSAGANSAKSGNAAGGASAKPGSAAAAKLGGNTNGSQDSSEGAGFDSKGSFKIKSAAANADGAGTGGSPFTTPILMILGAFVIAGATLSQFVSRNPNSR